MPARHFALQLLIIAAPLLGASSAEIRALLANRVGEAHRAVGIVAATIGPSGREVIAYGKRAKDGPPVDGDTFFEIGSITKVFTSLLLADMVERGELTLDTPVAKLLPESVKVPSRNGKQITLLDISMQVSGLPRMPSNFHPADEDNPFADYDAAKLYEFLSGYTLTREIGQKYEYSNLAFGLLGHALARKAGMTYEQLLRKRILDPLGMNDTTIRLTSDQRKRLATGHDPTLSPVKIWDFDCLAGAGAIRSTVNDMLKFLAANLELTDTPLKSALRRMRAVRRETGAPDLEIMMAWHVWKKYGTEIIWHNGGTGGYRTFTGFDPVRKTGVVVLCNTSFNIDNLGLHTLDPQWPAPKMEAPRQRKEISVDPTILETYTGEYRFAPQFSIKVTTENGRLFTQATNQPRVEAFAEKETEFFLKIVDAQISFVTDDSGKVTAMVLHQNGANPRGEKVP
jgi:D-alanyl-D-alanine-carboxypeptidase/D-alanyl-D-alanine-endopeptidase